MVAEAPVLQNNVSLSGPSQLASDQILKLFVRPECSSPERVTREESNLSGKAGKGTDY